MLGDVVREAARRFGDTPVIVTEEGHSLTYTQLDRLSDEVAAGMERRGLRRGQGDVVGLLMSSGPGYVVAYAAAAKIGAVTAGVNERLSPPEKVACLKVAQPSLVIAEDEAGAALASQISPASSGTEVLVSASCGPADSLLADLRVEGATSEPLGDEPDRPVAIVFTSGTTGLPKGALFCDRQLDAISEADGGRRFGSGGRGLGSTSMAHLGTMTKLPQSLRGGGTTFLMKRWSAGEALEMVQRHGITTLGGIPTQIALMLRHQNFATTDVSSVRLIALGGGPSAPALVREAREKFGIPVVVRYTCTEAGVGTGTMPEDPPEDAEESVGRPRPGVEVTIRDFGTEAVARGSVGDIGATGASGRELPAGEIGEICLRSEAVMAGYFRDPEATRPHLRLTGRSAPGTLGTSMSGAASTLRAGQGDVRKGWLQRLSPRGRGGSQRTSLDCTRRSGPATGPRHG